MAFVDSQRQTRNLHALLRVAKALASEIRLDDLLQVIVKEAAEVMDADRATLFLYDESRNELWSKTTQRLEIKEIRLPLGAGIAGHVAKTRTAINIPTPIPGLVRLSTRRPATARVPFSVCP